MQIAVQFLEHEISLIENECPHPQDLRIVSAYYHTDHFKKNCTMQGPDLTVYQKKIADQLHGLKWRCRIQEYFWFAVEDLTNKGLLKLERITSPIDCNDHPGKIWEIVSDLECFDIVQQCMELEAGELEGMFQAPVIWFATLVRRCSVDVSKTLDYLSTTGLFEGIGLFGGTGLFGCLDESHIDDIDRMVQDHGGPTTDAEVSMAYDDWKLPDDGKLPAMGFWLPQTFDDVSGFGQRWHRRYSQTVWVYEKWFGKGSWGDWSGIELSVRRAAQLGMV